MENEKVVEMLDEKLKGHKDALVNEVKGAKEAVENFKSEISVKFDEADKRLAENSKRLDTFLAEQGRKNLTPQKGASFKDVLGKALENESSRLKGYGSDRSPINIELKDVGNMVSGNLTTSGTETFAGNTFFGIGRKPYETAHIRNLVSVRPISTDSAYVIRDNAGEGGPTAVDMGSGKPQSDRDYVKLIQPVTKIAHYFKIPEEMLADNAWLTGEISTVGIEDLLAKEDDLLLNQVGGAGRFAGLTRSTNSTAFSAPASLALAIDNANNYDVLVAAWTQLRNLQTSANYILCNPSDYAAMVLTKASSSDGTYVFGAPNIQIPNVFGIPLVPHTAISSDKFLVGDFSKATIGQRAGVTVRFYDQNEDDAIKNMVTVVIEERLTVVTDRADRLVYGDFSDARAALEKA
jgi:HK97 family phage major capsid protein